MTPKPPVVFDALLKLYCKQANLEDIQGDLYEVFDERVQESVLQAKWLFILDVLRLLLPFTKNKKRATWFSESYSYNFKNGITIAIRYLKKNPFIISLKVLGLAFALSSFFFITDYTRFHASFDDFHERKERVFRIVTKVNSPDMNDETAWSHSYLKDIVDEFPEVEQMVRLLKPEVVSHVKVDNKNFEEHNVFHTDPEFAMLFSYNWIEGDPKTALIEPGTVVITEKTALKYL